MSFRIIQKNESPLILPIFRATIATGEYLTLAPDASDILCMEYWFGTHPQAEVWVLEEDGKVLGSYYQRPNQYGLGAHIANGGYIVSEAARGKGIGRKLAEHSIQRARQQGYRAMQFNFVVSTNHVAVRLWKSLGFSILGTIPEAYHLQQQRYVDAYVMYLSFNP